MALNINELETIVTPIAAIAAFVVRYGNTETDYLKSRDKLLGEAIDKIGHIKRPVDTDLFSSVIQHIIGQQISSVAQKTILQRMQVALGEVNTNTITGNAVEELQKTIKGVQFFVIRHFHTPLCAFFLGQNRAFPKGTTSTLFRRSKET